jgi:hypothetical protein
MKLAIMQPYFMPYIGYFQLIASVDKFVVYDDVSFIKGGWINRNNIKVQGQAKLITIPLQNGNSGVPIREVLIAGKKEYWSKKFLRTVAESYSKAPYFEQIYPIFQEWISSKDESISQLNVRIIEDICSYLSLDIEIEKSSGIYSNADLSSVARVLDICKIEGATHYINAIGGRELYSHETFQREQIKLSFLQPVLNSYAQGKGAFIKGLSILDVLMFNDAEEVRSMLTEYQLID